MKGQFANLNEQRHENRWLQNQSEYSNVFVHSFEEGGGRNQFVWLCVREREKREREKQ